MQCVRIKYLEGVVHVCGDGCERGGQNAKENSALQKIDMREKQGKETNKKSADGSYYIIGLHNGVGSTLKKGKGRNDDDEKEKRAEWLFRKGVVVCPTAEEREKGGADVFVQK
jgi:hypothetical protein